MKERTVTLVMASCLSITLSWLTTCWMVRGMPGEKPIEAGVSPQQPDRTGPIAELDVEKLIVRRELIVSDTGKPWEEGFERQEIPRGVYARSLGTGIAGVAVRGRLIKSEIDDHLMTAFTASMAMGRRAAPRPIGCRTVGRPGHSGRRRTSHPGGGGERARCRSTAQHHFAR